MGRSVYLLFLQHVACFQAHLPDDHFRPLGRLLALSRSRLGRDARREYPSLTVLLSGSVARMSHEPPPSPPFDHCTIRVTERMAQTCQHLSRAQELPVFGLSLQRRVADALYRLRHGRGGLLPIHACPRASTLCAARVSRVLRAAHSPSYIALLQPERMADTLMVLFSMILGATLYGLFVASLTSFLADSDASAKQCVLPLGYVVAAASCIVLIVLAFVSPGTRRGWTC
jgi:hypothetical protein|eukprot:2545102-Prymnesium_polylepis.2